MASFMLVGEGGGHKHKREAIWTIAWLPHFLSSWGQVGLDLRTPQNSWYLACPFTNLKGFMFWSRPERHRRSLLSMVFNNFPLPRFYFNCSFSASSSSSSICSPTSLNDIFADNIMIFSLKMTSFIFLFFPDLDMTPCKMKNKENVFLFCRHLHSSIIVLVNVKVKITFMFLCFHASKIHL